MACSAYAISNHLVGQAVCDRIDERHKSILPPRIWGEVPRMACVPARAEEMKNTARAAAKFGVKVVPGFTGSPIWHMVYSFPPNPADYLEKGLAFFAADVDTDPRRVPGGRRQVRASRCIPPRSPSTLPAPQNALNALGGHPAFGFNYDPSHFVYQNVDYVGFIRKFADRIFHVHMKDAYLASHPTEAGVFGGHLNFGDHRRAWDFRSLGRGSVNFEEIIRALNDIGYCGSALGGVGRWQDGPRARRDRSVCIRQAPGLSRRQRWRSMPRLPSDDAN